MAYGTIKVDTITFTDGAGDKSITISGLVQNPTFTGNVTVTGTVSGTTATFTTGTFTSLTGTTSQGTTATYTSGSFTSLTGVTTSGTTANFVSGVFTTQISGATITGTAGAFATLTGGVATLTSGVFALGTQALPSITFTGDTDTGIYSPGANQVAITTSGTGRLFVNANGNVGIATADPGQRLTVGDGSATGVNYLRVHSANSDLLIGQSGGSAFGMGTSLGGIVGSDAASQPLAVGTFQSQPLLLGTNNTEYLRITSTGTINIKGAGTAGVTQAVSFNSNAPVDSLVVDSSGRLLVGTASSFAVGTIESTVQVQSAAGLLSLYRYGGASVDAPAVLNLGRSRGTTPRSVTAVADGDRLGSIVFNGANGTDASNFAAWITCEVDGQPFTSGDTTDLPGRLVFSTTADGASSPTERMRITSGGYFKATSDNAYTNASGLFHEVYSTNASEPVLLATATSNSYTGQGYDIRANRAASNLYAFFRALSSNGGSVDNEFVLYGDGNGNCDGAWTGGGADYAEYFEWSDSNPDAEDRRGISVVLDGDKIREAVAGEDPIGVISGNPSVVGDAAWNKWSGKYLRDEFGTYIQEDYEVADDDGNTVIQQRRKLNPAYDPDVEYISREQRPEWDCVGLMGKLRIRKGQVTGSRWIKMRDISATVEEWLVR